MTEETGPSTEEPKSSNESNGNDQISRMTKKEKRERLTSLMIIAVIALLSGIDYAIILPTAWEYINSFVSRQYATLAMGILLSVFALSGAIAGLIFGYLNDIGISLKRLIMIGIVFQSIGNLLYFIGINIYCVILSRFIAGIGLGLVPPLLAEITRRSTLKTRTQLLTKILAFRQIGLLLGPCLTLILQQLHAQLFGIKVTVANSPGLLMAALWIISGIFTMFFFHDAPRLSQILSNPLFQLSFVQACRNIGLLCRRPVIIVLLITSFIAYFNQTALETTLTPFTNVQFNWNALQVSILFAAAGIEIGLVYVILYFATKKFSEQLILLFGFGVLIVACLIAVIFLPFSGEDPEKYLPLFLLFVALDVFALPLIVVATTSLFFQQTHNDHQGIGQGVQRAVVNLAMIAGPLFAGLLLKSVWIMLCIMFLIVTAAAILLILVYEQFKPFHTDESTPLISE